MTDAKLLTLFAGLFWAVFVTAAVTVAFFDTTTPILLVAIGAVPAIAATTGAAWLHHLENR